MKFILSHRLGLYLKFDSTTMQVQLGMRGTGTGWVWVCAELYSGLHIT